MAIVLFHSFSNNLFSCFFVFSLLPTIFIKWPLFMAVSSDVSTASLTSFVWEGKSDRFKEIFTFYPGESLNIAYCQLKYVFNGWACVMLNKSDCQRPRRKKFTGKALQQIWMHVNIRVIRWGVKHCLRETLKKWEDYIRGFPM